MASLLALIEQLQSKLDRFRKEGLKETPTRTIFIDPLLEALGWDVRDPDEVQLEYPTVDGKSVDYALKINGKAVLLVEAKGLNDPLTDVKDITQTTGYAANDGIVWCILTNGVRWRVYRSIEQCPAPEKLMFEISLDPRDLEGTKPEQVVAQFQRFCKEEMAKGRLDIEGEQTFTDGRVRKALQRLIADPPRALIKLVRDATNDKSLQRQTVGESLARVLMPILSASSAAGRAIPGTESSGRKIAARKSWITSRARENSPYTEDWHTQSKPQEVQELYRRLDSFCLGLRPGAVVKHYLAKYIAYREGKRTFCSIHLFRGGLRVWLKTHFQDIPNPPSFARDVSRIGHWGVGDVELGIATSQQIVQAEPIIKAVFEGG